MVNNFKLELGISSAYYTLLHYVSDDLLDRMLNNDNLKNPDHLVARNEAQNLVKRLLKDNHPSYRVQLFQKALQLFPTLSDEV